nr:hypothetical protein [Tanacetum cinerariifolium]
SEEDSIEYPTSEGDDDADDDGDDLSDDDVDDEDEEESSDSKEEEEEHLAPTVPAPALYSSVFASEETKPFMEGETAAAPPPFGYRVSARISVQPHILMPFRSESEVERLLAIPTPPLLCISGSQGAKISPLSPQSAYQFIISSNFVSYDQSRPNLPSSSSSNRTLAYLISTSRKVDGIDEGNGNDEVGSGVNIGNGIRNGGNGYDVGKTGDSGGVGMASNLSTSDSERNGICDRAVGSGYSLAGSISSAGGRYSGYSGP